MGYNWKGQGYESIEAFRSHLIYFEWPIVAQFVKEGTTGIKDIDEALSLRPIPGTKPKGNQSSKKVV